MKLSTEQLQNKFKYYFDTASCGIHKKAARSTAATDGNGPDLTTCQGGC